MTTDTRAATTATDVQMIIGGEQVAAADGQTFEVMNPATGQVIARAPLGGPEDVNRAVTAAQKAFDDPKGWATWSAAKRGRMVNRTWGDPASQLHERHDASDFELRTQAKLHPTPAAS